jgi:co-chaperonin GroES (HSP10)
MADFTKLKPIKNAILFQFLDTISGQKSTFNERTNSGLFIPRLASAQKSERWGKVIAVGPDAEKSGVAVGDFILIEALMWTHGQTYDGEKIWRTNDQKVLAVSNELSDTVMY